MSKIRQTLKLLADGRMSRRQVAAALNISKTTVADIALFARAAGVDAAQAGQLSDEALRARLYPPSRPRVSRLIEPDYAWMHQELKRASVTLQLLWEEYHGANGELAYRYSAFCQRYPDIEIELEVANRARIIERLRANEDDLYIMSFPPEELDVVATPFLDNPLVVVAPAAYPLPAGPHSLADLVPHPFLLRETGSGTRKAVDRHLAANGLTLKVKLALGSNEAIRDLVASGMGLAILSRHVLGEHPEQEGLRILEVAGFPLQQPWSVVHLRQKILSLPAHAFMNELLPAVRMAADTP